MMDDIRETTTEADPGEPTALEKAAREVVRLATAEWGGGSRSEAVDALEDALEAGPVGDAIALENPYSLCAECTARKEGRKLGTCFQGTDCIDLRNAWREGRAIGRAEQAAKDVDAHADGRAEMAAEARGFVDALATSFEGNAVAFGYSAGASDAWSSAARQVRRELALPTPTQDPTP